MATILPDAEANKLVPKVVTTDDDRLRLKVVLERSDLVRIAYAAARLLKTLNLGDAQSETPEAMPVALNARTHLLIRLRNWAGNVEPEDLVEPRIGGSST